MTGLLVFCLLSNTIWAANTQTIPESPQLQQCLKRADELPDQAAAEAGAWIKNNGGNDAHVCLAFADTNRGLHKEAAQEFSALAAFYDMHDAHRAVMMHNLAAQAFVEAKDNPDAFAQYALALKIAPKNVMTLLERAKLRISINREWDAIDDLNRVLKIQPGNVDALRQRGRAWAQLGNNKNAQEDFEQADNLSTVQFSK